MKIALKLLFAALVILQASLACADDIRVAVELFGGNEGDDPVLNQKAGVICAEEVMRTKGLAYVSPSDFAGALTGNKKTDREGPINLEGEYGAENAKMLGEMIDRETKDLALLEYVIRMFGAADTALYGAAVRKGGLVRVEVKIEPPLRLRADNEVDYSFVVECEEGRLDGVLRGAMKLLLEKILKAGKIYADAIGDADWAEVTYVLKALDGRYMAVEMVYEKGVPDPDIENVSMLPPEGIDENAKTTISVMSQEGKKVDVEFDYKAGNLEGVTIYAPRPEPSKDTGRTESLTLKSEAGYLLEFDFEWKDDDSVANVKIGPKVNPFTGK